MSTLYIQEQFNDIYSKNRSALHRYLLKLTGNPHDAADLLQETFLKLFQKGAAPETAKAWLFQTGYHLFIDNWRKRKKYRYTTFDSISEPVCESNLSPEAQYISREAQQDMMRVVDQLKPKVKAVIMIRVQEGATYQEIAEQLGCSENTVKSVIRRARLKMRKIMD